MDELTDYEKLLQGIYQFANLVHEYYKALRSEGFSTKEALELTISYQNEIVRLANSKGTNHVS